MNKHALMLTAATVALMTAPANAADYSSITKTKVTTAIATSTASSSGTASNIDIGSGGSVVVTLGTPAVTVDSNNSVTLSTSDALISNKATASAIGIQLNATAAGQGPGAGNFAVDNSGTIDLTGANGSKAGIDVVDKSGNATGIFNGGIKLEAGSTLNLTGDGSMGIAVGPGTTLNGDVTILGSLTGQPTTVNSTSSGSLTGVYIAGNMNGNFSVGTGATVETTGSASVGFNLAGVLTGSFVNNGNITVTGTSSAKPAGGNPEAGSAVIIGNSVSGGIYNAGPLTPGSATARATIAAYGPSPALDITPGTTIASGTHLTIGPYTGADAPAPNYDLVNRGTISAQGIDADINSTAVSIAGTATSPVDLLQGIFNGGQIQASATTDAKATAAVYARALVIGDNANVSTLVNNVADSGSGQIVAAVSGTNTGEADAISIAATANGGPTAGTPMTLTNTGVISAAATTSDTTITALNAYAIKDLSGTLQTITNSGTISATATTLDGGTQKAVALDLGAATGGVTLTNTGAVIGDILLGSHNDIVTLNGTASQAATITGNISFNGGIDTLTIGDYSTVNGAITERGGGSVNVTVGSGTGSGTLNLTNTTTGLNVGDLKVLNGGTLNIAVAQAFNQSNSGVQTPIVSATGNIDLAVNSHLGLSFGSFISTPGGTGAAKFILLDAGAGKLAVNNYSTVAQTVESTKPFLFNVNLCGYNLTGAGACGTTSTTTDSQLVLELTPKSASDLKLTGNAANIFDAANAALANDDALGAAIINGVTDTTTAQAAYEGFLPDLSGSSRAVAISLTDPATGPVGARQRALRMYAAQPGGTTMWGQEFAQRLNSGTDIGGYRSTGFGFALGADSGSPESGRYGGAFTFFSGDQTNKSTNFTKTSNEWYMLSGYTDWRGKGLFLDTQVSVGYGNLNGKRYLELTNPANNVVTKRTATSKRAGLLVSGGLTTGAVFTYGGTVLTPQVSIDALTMREGGYTEYGGGNGFDLKVQPYYANSARGSVGVTVRQDIDFDGFYVQPQGRVGYRYDFLADPVKLKAAFASVGNQFTLTGPDPERGDVIAGGGLAVTTGAWSLGVNYDYIRGTKGAVSQAGTITLVGRI